ncbi:MAG: glycosyltransferase family 2 protein [Ruthenibacterium sp.]
MAEIAVLIPCYNEEKTVGKVVADYRAVLPEATIYIYNNNSTDGTLAIAQRLAAADGHVVVRNEYRQGKGNVIRSMFRDITADCYLMIDGDDTYPAEDAPQMVEAVLTGRADMVIGDRLSSTYFTENKRPFHNFGNMLVRGLINGLFGAQVKDIMTGYRAFSRPFVKGFPVLSKGFEIETEMTIHAVDKNFLLVELPVAYRDRPDGSQSKLNTYSDGAKVLKTIVSLFKEYKPMAFFGLAALLLFAVAAVMFIPVLVEYTRTGLVPRFPTLIVSCVLGVCALLSLLVGVILDVEVKKHRQLYELLMNYYLANQNAGAK